jgi:hypothetical protein
MKAFFTKPHTPVEQTEIDAVDIISNDGKFRISVRMNGVSVFDFEKSEIIYDQDVNMVGKTEKQLKKERKDEKDEASG